MKTVAIIQARMRSTRLPGKVLMDIGGSPLLLRVVERARASNAFNDVLVATSGEEGDDPVAAFCAARNIACFRGSHDDVLDRYFQAATRAKADVITRLTADCPLLDPAVTREIVRMFQSGGYDYVSNVIDRTYPDGLDAETFDFATLAAAHKEAVLPSEREHVTPFIHKHPERFRIGHLKHDTDLTIHRWTVDEPRDVTFVRELFRHMNGELWGMEEIIALLERYPDLQTINAGIPTNEGMKKSYEEDAKFLQSRL